MNSIDKYLNESNITMSEITKELNLGKGDVAILYSSHVEGLGSDYSDLDIYVFCNNIEIQDHYRNEGKYFVESKVINMKKVDIEYWQKKDIDEIVKKLNNSNEKLSREELKILHRMNVALVIQDAEAYVKTISKSKLIKEVYQLFTLDANSYLEDGIVLYKAGYLESSLMTMYKAIENAMAAYNAKLGITNIKSKWIATLFLKNCQDDILIKKFNELIIYTEIKDLKKLIEEMIKFQKKIINTSLFI